MGCDHLHEMISAYIDRALSDAEMLLVEGHLNGCDCCRKYLRLEQETKRLVCRCSGCEAPAALRETIRRLLDRECGAAAGRG